MYLDAHGDMFNFQQCIVLREPDEYASVLWLGKDDAAANMRCWSDKIIAQSLTTIEDAKANKMAVKVYKALLGFAGDKKYTYPDTLVSEIVGEGIKNEVMRAEIFAQIMKQLTRNPNPQSVTRLWHLLMLCLLSFSPGDSMDNYVHIFIRKNAPASMKEPLVKRCHRAAYDDAAEEPPKGEDVADMLAKAGLRPDLSKRMSGAYNR